jgi:hypothetical protein
VDLLDDLDAAALAQASASLAAAVGGEDLAAAPDDLAAAAEAITLASRDGAIESQGWPHSKTGPPRPNQPDPLSVSAPSGGASPATSAAPLVAAYEHSAAVGSAVVDAWDRRPFFNGGKRDATSYTEPTSSDDDEDKEKIAAAMGGAAAAAALGGPYAASTLLYSLWRDPSVAALALQTWGLVDGLVFPAGTGRP